VKFLFPTTASNVPARLSQAPVIPGLKALLRHQPSLRERLNCLHPQVGKRDLAGVRLQADESGDGIDARRVAAEGVAGFAFEARRLLAVQPHDVGVAAHFNLVLVPRFPRELLGVLVILLTVDGAEVLDFVNGAGVVKREPVSFADALVAAGLLINLDFKAGVHRDVGLIVVKIRNA
jgi:hypothetical protein